MGKLGKIALGAGLFLALSGGILAFAGRTMGADTSLTVNYDGASFQLTPFGINDIHGLWYEGERGDDGPRPGFYPPTAFQDKVQSFTFQPEDFDRLELDVDMGSIILERGSAFNLEAKWYSDINYKVSYSQNGGVLTVTGTAPDPRKKTDVHCDALVTITVPDGVPLSTVSGTVDMGTVYLADLAVERVTLDCSMGSLTLISPALGIADLSADMGSIEIRDAKITQRLTADASMGSVTVSGDLDCDLDLSADMGAVECYTSRPLSDYSYDLEADMGAVSLNDSDYDDHLSGGGGKHTVKLSANMGAAAFWTDGQSESGWDWEDEEAWEWGDSEIVDLPDELYASYPAYEDKSVGFYANYLGYDFTVSEPTTMVIGVENLSGTLELGIRNRGVGWAYEQRAFESESDTVDLEPGTYTVVIKAEAFQGSYHLAAE